MGAYLVIFVFIAFGYGLLTIAFRTERRVVRIVVGLIGFVYLLLLATMTLFAAVGDGNTTGVGYLVFSVIFAISGLAALVLAFVPLKSDRPPPFP